jgi:hypothetical protein
MEFIADWGIQMFQGHPPGTLAKHQVTIVYQVSLAFKTNRQFLLSVPPIATVFKCKKACAQQSTAVSALGFPDLGTLGRAARLGFNCIFLALDHRIVSGSITIAPRFPLV